MAWLYPRMIRPWLFTLDSEEIHNRTLDSLAWVARSRLLTDAIASFLAPQPLPVEVIGLKFPNPLGLAAGMDKYAVAAPAWAAMGFGFSELGGVTWHPQTGNPPPRVFRAVAEGALINRMGFNNPGAAALAQTLIQWRQAGLWPAHPIGVNLGKSRLTPLDLAAEDYLNSFRLLWPHADFFVVNVSSPNTPNLRQLQDKAALDQILTALKAANEQLGAAMAEGDRRSRARISAITSRVKRANFQKPILVKVAPDLSSEALDEILDLAGPLRLAGIVATNTTIERPATNDPGSQRAFAETGGLSGRPLRRRSTEIIRHVFRRTQGKLPIIGVGGIFNAEDAWEKITSGASLVQVYTGLVFQGPGMVREIVDGLRRRLAENGITNLRDAVGIAAR